MIPSIEQVFWNLKFSIPSTVAPKNLGVESERDIVAHHSRPIALGLKEHAILTHAEAAVPALRCGITRTIRIDKNFDIRGRCARSRQRHAIHADINHAISM